MINQGVPKKLSLRRLKQDAGDEGIPLPNPQSERMQSVTIQATSLETRAEYVKEIGRLWTQAQDRFLQIGNYLIFAKMKLQHGEYERMISEELPFQRSVAHALRAVAEAVRDERLFKDELPNSYSTAYLLTSLPDDGIEEARNRGLVGPDVRRAQVAQFCREFRQKGLPNTTSQSLLLKERDALLLQRRRIDERLSQIERALGEQGKGGRRRGAVIDGKAIEVAAE
ncbi:MAG TPA: hypothetical protein VIL69_02225 [Roseomonas sp.]